MVEQDVGEQPADIAAVDIALPNINTPVQSKLNKDISKQSEQEDNLKQSGLSSFDVVSSVVIESSVTADDDVSEKETDVNVQTSSMSDNAEKDSVSVDLIALANSIEMPDDEVEFSVDTASKVIDSDNVLEPSLESNDAVPSEPDVDDSLSDKVTEMDYLQPHFPSPSEHDNSHRMIESDNSVAEVDSVAEVGGGGDRTNIFTHSNLALYEHSANDPKFSKIDFPSPDEKVTTEVSPQPYPEITPPIRDMFDQSVVINEEESEQYLSEQQNIEVGNNRLLPEEKPTTKVTPQPFPDIKPNSLQFALNNNAVADNATPQAEKIDVAESDSINVQGQHVSENFSDSAKPEEPDESNRTFGPFPVDDGNDATNIRSTDTRVKLHNWIVIVEGREASEKRYYFNEQVLVGRHIDCDIVINDGYVSRRHFYLRKIASNWVLEHLAKNNFTEVNQKQVTQGEIVVKNGDSVVLGNHTLRVHLDEVEHSNPLKFDKKDWILLVLMLLVLLFAVGFGAWFLLQRSAIAAVNENTKVTQTVEMNRLSALLNNDIHVGKKKMKLKITNFLVYYKC